MTTSLGEVERAVRAVSDHARRLEALLAEAAGHAAEAADLLAPAGCGSRREDEFLGTASAWRDAADEADCLRTLVTAARTALDRYLTAPPPPPPPLPPPPTSDPVRSVRSPSGDHYPVEAGWGAHLMGRYSAPRSGVPVHGLARAKGSETTLSFRPGEQYWTERVVERARFLRAGAAFWKARVHFHVEFETAAWMVESGVREAELIVNRTPCGYRMDLERQPGCHQYLRRFLPVGSALHVYGTDENGRKTFIATYRGLSEQ
ncbi:DddA-like double-stranded DNA deaminase toxin [Saccharothrix hoggarensis]|uniref:DddA-like double-stranded DNA deaminase toxin n=1 Tax=Saccharothrix hoggarensis TaxID=913853 RepID=A0ABW3QPM5_9PSEU